MAALEAAIQGCVMEVWMAGSGPAMTLSATGLYYPKSG
jgi:hypothetical protein